MMKVTKVTPRILTGGAGAPPIRTALRCSSRSLVANWEGVLSRGRGREHCLRAPQLSYLVLPTTLQSPFPDEETEAQRGNALHKQSVPLLPSWESTILRPLPASASSREL